MKVSLNLIRNNPYNTRQDYGDLTGLIESIKRFGLTQPFLAREADGNYEIAFGSRRLEALKSSGQNQVDIEVRQLNNADMATLAICENIHRKDLNPVELASAYEKGIKTTRLSLHAFAGTIQESDTKIKGYLNILSLPEAVLKNQGRYTATQLICLGKLNEISPKVRIALDNLLGEKYLPSSFLKQIVSSCESVFGSRLPWAKKKKVCYEIIFHDYSNLPPENFKDIQTFADAILEETLFKYDTILKRTQEALRKAREKRRKIKKVGDIIHTDKKLDDLTYRLREAGANVKRVIEHGYYARASKRSKGKFRTSVNRLVTGLEEILKNGQ